eukprot:TRINITY_DN23995_c0_g1_i1.p1 TRINITY_DN23995_c0_g1~~TRINITY_DN23995_c0_g1_i1.p1  ORF type:complete len:285 (+),score=93.77 TRINITY_DN23995_c0_g1_i1:123-977(+)
MSTPADSPRRRRMRGSFARTWVTPPPVRITETPPVPPRRSGSVEFRRGSPAVKGRRGLASTHQVRKLRSSTLRSNPQFDHADVHARGASDAGNVVELLLQAALDGGGQADYDYRSLVDEGAVFASSSPYLRSCRTVSEFVQWLRSLREHAADLRWVVTSAAASSDDPCGAAVVSFRVSGRAERCEDGITVTAQTRDACTCLCTLKFGAHGRLTRMAALLSGGGCAAWCVPASAPLRPASALERLARALYLDGGPPQREPDGGPQREQDGALTLVVQGLVPITDE